MAATELEIPPIFTEALEGGTISPLGYAFGPRVTELPGYTNSDCHWMNILRGKPLKLDEFTQLSDRNFFEQQAKQALDPHNRYYIRQLNACLTPLEFAVLLGRDSAVKELLTYDKNFSNNVKIPLNQADGTRKETNITLTTLATLCGYEEISARLSSAMLAMDKSLESEPQLPPGYPDFSALAHAIATTLGYPTNKFDREEDIVTVWQRVLVVAQLMEAAEDEIARDHKSGGATADDETPTTRVQKHNLNCVIS